MKEFSVDDKIKEFYDGYYNGTSAWRQLRAIDKVNNIVRLCSRYPHKKVLEIGSGEGAILNRLAELQFSEAFYSLEISNTAVDAIRQRNIKSLVDCRLFDGYNIPYDDKAFDLAILTHVLEHVEYPRKILYEASRVASNVYVEVPLEDNIRLKKDFTLNTIGHINFYSKKTIRRLIQTSGFEILDQSVINSSYSAYKFQYGKKGLIRYLTKELALKVIPFLATNLFTFDYSMLIRKKVCPEAH